MAGKRSTLRSAPVTAHGSFSAVWVSSQGANHYGSSSSVARTLTKPMAVRGRVNTQLLHQSQ